MTTVTIAVPLVAGAAIPRVPTIRPARVPRVTFVSEGGDIIRVPFAPSEMTLESLTPSWSVIERPGKTELLVYERDQLPQVTFTIFIAAEDQAANPLGSVEQWITDFRKHLGGRQRWRFTYGTQVNKDWWRFTDASIKTQLRSPETNDIVVATADIQLTKASEITIKTGPVTGGLAPQPPTTSPTGAATYATYTIKSSADTLWNLAVRFLGSGTRWIDIAALNNIKDPRTLRIGQVIKIPNASYHAPSTFKPTVTTSQSVSSSGTSTTVTTTTTYSGGGGGGGGRITVR